jgi:hypothetical protein
VVTYKITTTKAYIWEDIGFFYAAFWAAFYIFYVVFFILFGSSRIFGKYALRHSSPQVETCGYQ